MNPLTQFKKIPILPLLIALALVALASPASATLPPGNTVQQWNKIAEDTVVGSGTFQPEGVVYMAYVSAAVYDAVVAIEGGFEPYGPPITAPPGASVDAAVVEAAYPNHVGLLPARIVQPELAAERVRVLPGSTSEPGRVLRGGSRRDPAGAGQDGRTGSRATGCEQHYCPPQGRRPNDPDQRELVLPHAAARTERVAPHAAVRGAADTVGRADAPICPAEPGPVPT